MTSCQVTIVLTEVAVCILTVLAYPLDSRCHSMVNNMSLFSSYFGYIYKLAKRVNGNVFQLWYKMYPIDVYQTRSMLIYKQL